MINDEEHDHAIEISGAILECRTDDAIIRGGRSGEILFVVQEEEVEKHEKSMTDFRMSQVIPEVVRTKWNNPLEREVEQVVAQHKAELMHNNAVTAGDEEDVKAFAYKGYAVQVAVWCNEKVEVVMDWVTSE